MTKFFLVRHGETEWNREMVFRGQSDIPLSERGREQARRLAEVLAVEPIAAIYSSPLSRARETAEIIASCRGLKVGLRDELMDMDFGEWEGLSVAGVQARYPEGFRLWAERPSEFISPGGEGLRAVRQRVKGGLAEWVSQHPEENIILITHRVVCKVMLCEVLGLKDSAFWKIQQDVCGLNVFAANEGKYVLLRMNDTCHLRTGAGSPEPDF